MNTATAAVTRARRTHAFLVNTPDGGSVIVEATSEKAALAHVVGTFFKSSKLTQRELIDEVKKGTPVESAVEPDAAAPAAGEAPPASGE